MSTVIEMPEAATTARTAAETVAGLTNVTKRYANGVVALDGLSLTLKRGEIIALLGPNGAGKSTAVKLMMGLSAPTSGEVRIFGADPRDTATRLRTGVMLQVGKAPEMLRVREHINIFRGYYPRPMAYAEVIKAAGLEGIEERFFGQLSGGQKQRVLFGIALAGDPDLIFLDEPTVGLDIEARRAMWAQIRSLAARGKTVLLTTHYLEEADALAHRIIVINKGKVVSEGTPREIKSRTAARKIRCSTSLSTAQIWTMPGVVDAEIIDGIMTVTAGNAEAVLRQMLAWDEELSGLEVVSPGLEDAFLALTQGR